jgi:hypothetical protein
MERLKEIRLDAYDRLIGLELSELAVGLAREGWVRYRWEGRPSRRP